MIIEGLIVVVAAYALEYIWERFVYWRSKRSVLEENQEYVNQLQEFDGTYHPEKPDIQLARRCKDYLDDKFPNGIEEKIKGMSHEELLSLFQAIEKDAESMMGVEIDKVDFYTTEEQPDCNYCGYYRHDGNSFHINAGLIFSGEVTLIKEQIFTIFHELKHARQWKAILGEMDYGYSEEQLRIWAENFQHYISCNVNDELYRKQPVELDAFGFETLLKGERSFDTV